MDHSYHYEPDIFLLNQTWFRERDRFYPTGYKIYRDDRRDNFGDLVCPRQVLKFSLKLGEWILQAFYLPVNMTLGEGEVPQKQ